MLIDGYIIVGFVIIVGQDIFIMPRVYNWDGKIHLPAAADAIIDILIYTMAMAYNKILYDFFRCVWLLGIDGR